MCLLALCQEPGFVAMAQLNLGFKGSTVWHVADGRYAVSEAQDGCGCLLPALHMGLRVSTSTTAC